MVGGDDQGIRLCKKRMRQQVTIPENNQAKKKGGGNLTRIVKTGTAGADQSKNQGKW